MSKKNIILIIIVIAVIISLVVGGIFIFKDRPNSNNPSASSTEDEILTIEQELNKLENDYDKLKEQSEKYYGVTPHHPVIMDVEGKDVIISDLTGFFTKYPSQNLTNLKGNEVLFKDDLDEMGENIDKYNHLLISDDEIKIDTYKFEPIDIKISNKPAINDKIPVPTYYFNLKLNKKTIPIPREYFETEEEFYQACYDAVLEVVSRIPKEKYDVSFVPMVSNAEISGLNETIENKDYRLLFDAIMNHTFAIAYLSDDGIMTRIEAEDYVSQLTGEYTPGLYITTEYEFSK